MGFSNGNPERILKQRNQGVSRGFLSIEAKGIL